MDYMKLREFLLEGREREEGGYALTYYGSRPAVTLQKQRNFLFALQNFGYNLKISILKERHGQTKEKGVDANIVDDLNSVLQEGGFETVVLVGGDKDYLGTLEKLKRAKIKIELVSFEDSTSFELRIIANKFISLNKLKDRLELKRDSSPKN